jgi:Poly(ADP-ribose) polymerase catalytic domain
MQRIPIFMDDKAYQTISDRVRESYPNSCILFIDKVENPNLQIAYENRKRLIELERGKVEEMQLFHGTHANLIDKIAYEGFDPEKSVVAAYGPGTYFATNAGYSFSYMKSMDKSGISYMFYADVLIGKKGFKSDTTRCDNYVDSLKTPTIIVSPYGDGAFPRYVIAFHKNAK